MKMNKSMLVGMIAIVQQEMKTRKPRSARYQQLQFRLKELMTQQLRLEIRINKRHAA